MNGSKPEKAVRFVVTMALLICSCRKPSKNAVQSSACPAVVGSVPNVTPQSPVGDTYRYPKIEIYIGGIWELHISSDGSGTVAFGDNIIDQLQFPPKTFDFEDLTNNLKSRISINSNYTGCSVGFVESDKINVVQTRCLDDVPYVLNLFQKAHHAIEWENASLEKVWADTSPNNPKAVQLQTQRVGS